MPSYISIHSIKPLIMNMTYVMIGMILFIVGFMGFILQKIPSLTNETNLIIGIILSIVGGIFIAIGLILMNKKEKETL